MRIVKSTLVFTSLLAVAWSLACGDTPTPRPTYTPYPTFTVEAPTGTTSPTETAAQGADLGEVVELGGEKDWFYGDALSYAQDGISEFKRGNYQAAIDNLQQAKRLRDKPSAVLENWIGLSYRGLGMYEEAIMHHSASIQIEDSATERTNRGTAHLLLGECHPAIADAEAALAMEPESAEGFHTDAEANYILGSCYASDGQHLLALQHLEASAEISIENNYEKELISERELLAEQLREVLSQNGADIEFFVGPALEAWEQGLVWFNAGSFRKAVESFESAKKLHGKPSSVLESWLGLGFQSLGQHDTAIAHFTRSIEIRDSAVDRINRSASYMATDRCTRALQDARAALTLPPYKEEAYHSEAEANVILANCLLEAGDYRLAYVRAESALSSAIANGYPAVDIDYFIEVRDTAKSLADSQQ